MRRLDRASFLPPICLAMYAYPGHTWDDLSQACKAALRQVLSKMQCADPVVMPHGSLNCAYCESPIRHAGHIEHFRRKNPAHFPQLTFDWDNLFLSCDAKSNCGHYKDRPKAPAYNPADLIKPDQDDPDQFLYFHSTGHVRCRQGLDAFKANRASETIRVFGLDNGTLTGARRKALQFYRNKVLADLDELASWSPADRNAYLAGEVEDAVGQSFSATIRHFLQGIA